MINETQTKERIAAIETRLEAIQGERQKLLAELSTLQARKQLPLVAEKIYGTPISEMVPTSSQEKIDLFLRLFRCREDVFPKLWENPRNGKKGYSPACNNEWIREVCDKPRIKCSECSLRCDLLLRNARSQRRQGCV